MGGVVLAVWGGGRAPGAEQRSAVSHQRPTAPWALTGDRLREIETNELIPKPSEATFGLERDLQLALFRSNIEQLEPGLPSLMMAKEHATTGARADRHYGPRRP